MGRAHRLRGLAYAAVFMALQTHTALPHGICLDGCACVHVCVHELYEEGGVRERRVVVVGRHSPFCPAPGFVSPFPA